MTERPSQKPETDTERALRLSFARIERLSKAMDAEIENLRELLRGRAPKRETPARRRGRA